MAGPSNTFEKAIFDCLFKKTNITAPTTLFVSLHSADPGDTGASELSGGSYARAQLDPDTDNTTHVNWNSVDQGTEPSSISNKLDITFPTATGNWANATHFCLWSAVSGGTLYWSGTIASGNGIQVNNGNTAKFLAGSPGQLSVTLA